MLSSLRSSRSLWRSDRRYVRRRRRYPRHAACAKGHSRCNCKAGVGREDPYPAPAALDIYLPRAGAVSFSRATHTASSGRRNAPRRRRGIRRGERLSMTYRAGKAWNLFCLEEPPLFCWWLRGPRRASSPRRIRAPAAEGQEDEAQGRAGPVGPAETKVLGLARPPLREAGVALRVLSTCHKMDVTPKPPPAGSLGGK